MVPLAALWLPILLSAVIVFIASSVIHMVLPWHKNDYARVPDEERLRSALQPLAIPPGDYVVPRPSGREELRAPEFLARVNEGPNLVLTVLPNGPWTMGRNLGLWFAYLVVVAVFAAYVTGRVLAPESDDDRALVELNAALAVDPRWETVLLPMADGLTMLRKR